jgi:protein-S-isoprenylcysteine O-methyltransferase Ste14
VSYVLAAGIGADVALICALLWSIAKPQARLWPPRRHPALAAAIVWLLTIVAFASALWLGVVDWNGLGWPAWLRWGIGMPLILAGNAVVWTGVAQLGMAATAGARDDLTTEGLYRFSRNPQYVADMALLLGWIVLSASLWVIPVALGGVLALALAPFAEEPWLAQTYGAKFSTYRARVRRFF